LGGVEFFSGIAVLDFLMEMNELARVSHFKIHGAKSRLAIRDRIGTYHQHRCLVTGTG
jgi:hypothetical protein